MKGKTEIGINMKPLMFGEKSMACLTRALIFFSTLMVLAIWGCEQSPETESQQASQGLRKKIAVPQKTVKAPPKRQKTVVARQPSKQQARKQPRKAARRRPQPPPPTKRGLMEPKKSDSLRLAEGFSSKPAFFYDPTGKHDPFESPFEVESDQRVGMAPTKKEVQKKRVPLTPLQRIELSQLKLVAVVVASSGNKALVEDPSGKGYIISPGTYVGQNFGRVKQILKDRVIVEGEVEDFFSGKPKVELTELMLQSKVGDG